NQKGRRRSGPRCNSLPCWTVQSPIVQGLSLLRVEYRLPKALMPLVSSVAIPSLMVVLLWLRTAPAALQAMGLELVPFSTRVIAWRRRMISAPAKVLPVPQADVGDCNSPSKLRLPTQESTVGNSALTKVFWSNEPHEFEVINWGWFLKNPGVQAWLICVHAGAK